MRIWYGKNSDPGSGMEKSRIRDPGWDKHPGSATLVLDCYYSRGPVPFFFGSTFLLAPVRGMCDNYASFDVQMVAQYQECEGFVLCTGGNVEMFMKS